ncbi:MAG: hypothetical protein LBI04_10880, partial [Treponema sp.]|nr:hypothetical protein [Treponema sp.]
MKLTGKRVILKGLLIMSAVFFMAACSSPDDTNTNGGDKVLSGTVTITGTAKVGQTLTADTFALNGDGTITYRWLRNDEPISGATGSTYLLDQDDHGKMIKVEVKRSGYDGVVTSAPKGPVAGTNDPDLTGTVSITGTAQVGYIFTANISALDGDGTPSYQWYRGDTAISNATGSTYTLVEADKDKLIKVEVGRSGYAGTKFSEARGPIAGSGVTPLLYEKQYWGEWIRMDNGQAYYFTSSKLTINNQPSTLSSSALTKESDKVIAVTQGTNKYWLYASRPATSSFTGRITDLRLTDGRSARSLGGFEDILIRIGDEVGRIIHPDPDGEFEVDEIVVEEDYEISFPSAPEIPPVIVTPNYNGDDIGTLNIVEGVNFKISVKAENSY